MASIQERKTKDGKVSFRVQVRLKGRPSQTATSDRKTDAKRWVNETESAIREGRYFKTDEARRHTLADMCDRYLTDTLPSKGTSLQRGQKQQLAWWTKRIGKYALADVTPALIAEQRDFLAKKVLTKPTDNKPARITAPATVVRYLAALSSAFSQAVNEWGWIEASPMAKVKKPREPKGRVRFLSDDERIRLLNACKKSENRYLYPIVLLAISTGARHGEIIGLEWKHIDFDRSRAVLFDTKNGDHRPLLLSPQLIAELELLRTANAELTSLVFASKRVPSKPMEVRAYWHTALIDAGINDFRFHDLRHTAASYLAMNGATTAELSEILGHKTLVMVKRYAHLTESHTRQVVTKMNDKLSPQRSRRALRMTRLSLLPHRIHL